MAAEPTIEEIHAILQDYPGLSGNLSIEKITRFIRLTAGLKRDILHAQKPTHLDTDIPNDLPDNVNTFLGGALNLSDDYVAGCWAAFKTTIWDYDATAHTNSADAKLFMEYGRKHGLGESVYFLPLFVY
jgi:hypothetical protein